MQRSIKPLGLLFTSVSAIIGSGWLFSSYYSAQLAGPAAILSWIIGGSAVVCVAFVFAELCALLPISGSSTRIPLFTHGTLVSFLFSWIIWLSYVALTPTEVQAMLQYASFYFPNLISASGGLSTKGYMAATFLMLIASTTFILCAG
jgi:amino acid transporter